MLSGNLWSHQKDKGLIVQSSSRNSPMPSARSNDNEKTSQRHAFPWMTPKIVEPALSTIRPIFYPICIIGNRKSEISSRNGPPPRFRELARNLLSLLQCSGVCVIAFVALRTRTNPLHNFTLGQVYSHCCFHNFLSWKSQSWRSSEPLTARFSL